ncbi:MAG: mechanosensitive ion channel [Proteobacteria bacterium]|nr:mechanosensitive ion channel [Pseudomonadota bacterium]MCP4916518.1 mechanosensitive ion channel [Pseudomonadota bacterium]
METNPQNLLQFLDLENVPLAAVVLIVGLVSARLLTGFVDDLGERLPGRRLLLKKVSALSRFFIYVITFAITASSVLVLESEALLAVAGTIGLAVGFAFKDLLASLMAGVILLIDEPFQVGDRVAFGGFYGEITEIGLRSVRMVTLDDNLVTIPNSAFLSEASASANAGALDCMVVIDFYIGAAEDFTKARRLIEEATATSRYIFLDKPMSTLVSDQFLGERFITVIKVKAYVFDTRFEKAFASDVTERVKVALYENDVRTPDRQYRDLDLNGGRETGEETRDTP